MTENSGFGCSRRLLLRAGALAVLAIAAAERASGQSAPSAGPIRIGIVGSGHIGGTLGALWVKAGHPVLFSSRHPEELASLAQSLGPLARTGSVPDALAFGDAVLMAVPYRAYPQIGKDNAGALAGKVVLDAGNAVPARDGEIATEARDGGIGETSAGYLAGARIVRAFNTLNYRILHDNANRAGARMAIPIAGDDQPALAVASALVTSAGFDPVVVGPLARARDFAQGAPLYGQQLTAAEMRRRIEALR